MQILFLSYLTQAPLVLFYVFTEQCKPHLSGRITTFGFVLFLLLLLVLLNKSSVKIVLRSFNPLFPFFVSSPYFSMNSLLRPKTIVVARQSHPFYVLIAQSLQSGMNGDEKELNRREKRAGYIEAVKEQVCGVIKAVTCEMIE